MNRALVSDREIDEATTRLAGHVTRTPLIPSPALSDRIGAEVVVKPELLQPTNSFKIRGAFNRALSLHRAERAAGLIAFSSGNHALAVAHVGARLGVPVTVCMPATAVPVKVDAVRRLGASLELVSGDIVEHVNRRREELGATLVHPFDHPSVVAATATIGREIVTDRPDIDTVIVPVGGGGLISGVAAAVKRAAPHARVIGVEPESADVVSRSLAAGRPVTCPVPRSLADGLTPPVTGEINLAHVEAYVDEVVRIPESAITPAWHSLVDDTKMLVEPSTAVSLAAIQIGAIELRADERVCLILCGGNADLTLLRTDGHD